MIEPHECRSRSEVQASYILTALNLGHPASDVDAAMAVGIAVGILLPCPDHKRRWITDPERAMVLCDRNFSLLVAAAIYAHGAKLVGIREAHD